MKGRTTCPKCKNEFILEMPKDCEKHKVVCPKCENNFFIRVKKDKSQNLECTWEEHGEPRKTILSSIKRKSNKPKFAAILLTIVFVLGTFTAVFSELFITTTMDVATNAGLTGKVEIIITDLSNKTLENIKIEINNYSGTTNEKGVFSAKNIKLGIQTIEISSNFYKNQSREILVTPFFNTETMIKLENDTSDTISKIGFDSFGCTIIIIIFSIIALLAGVACFKRQHLDAAVIGSLIGIFSFGFFFIGTILCIIALVIILKSREEFEDGKKGKVF